MIVIANTDDLKAIAASILLKETGVKATQEFQAIFWINNEQRKIEWVIGFDGFIGKVCQIHDVHLSGNSTPRELLSLSFSYPFEQLGMKALLGVVNSKNTRAMEYNRKLGFKEISRLEGMHDDGGDIVLMKMNKAECRWIKERKHEELLVKKAA